MESKRLQGIGSAGLKRFAFLDTSIVPGGYLSTDLSPGRGCMSWGMTSSRSRDRFEASTSATAENIILWRFPLHQPIHLPPFYAMPKFLILNDGIPL